MFYLLRQPYIYILYFPECAFVLHRHCICIPRTKWSTKNIVANKVKCMRETQSVEYFWWPHHAIRQVFFFFASHDRLNWWWTQKHWLLLSISEHLNAIVNAPSIHVLSLFFLLFHSFIIWQIELHEQITRNQPTISPWSRTHIQH